MNTTENETWQFAPAHGSASPMTDAEAVTDETICERNYLPSGWVPADFARQLEVRLRALLGVIEAHECTCFSCDRCVEQYCDCLGKEAKLAKAALTPNAQALAQPGRNQTPTP